MITQQDLEQAIAECQSERHPTANTCIKLAAFYIVHRELYGEEKDAGQLPEHSFAPAPNQNTIEMHSGSEFAQAVNGMDQHHLLSVMDELMSTLSIVQPRLYEAVMDRLV